MKVREKAPNVKNSTNFNIAADSKTKVGTTLENLKSAIAGETGAHNKYLAFAKAAKDQGYDQISRLFEATAAAEQIHIGLEYDLVSKMDPDYEKPTVDAPVPGTCDLNLISGANGEIYETSDMYPSFIKKAEEEGEKKAVLVFSRAKLAESVHAERYMDAYNDIDAPDDDKFYLCPTCGYIHKGEDFDKCPICFQPKDTFTAY
ncbi:nigerythrin [Pseudodesulfovibrio sp.]|uniref:nigerythrin n=1 Tax=unclassified Pseudodesulfovibrio TaxID=2661612 RepID=UPI003AFFE821